MMANTDVIFKILEYCIPSTTALHYCLLDYCVLEPDYYRMFENARSGNNIGKCVFFHLCICNML